MVEIWPASESRHRSRPGVYISLEKFPSNKKDTPQLRSAYANKMWAMMKSFEPAESSRWHRALPFGSRVCSWAGNSLQSATTKQSATIQPNEQPSVSYNETHSLQSATNKLLQDPTSLCNLTILYSMYIVFRSDPK